MSDVTRILSQIESGDPAAAEQLLPLVYDELRKLAAVRLAHEKPGQTLQATALVHEAYLRLIGPGVGTKETGVGTDSFAANAPSPAPAFHSRGHFFGAAAEAMRRILVERARRQLGPAHGGGRKRLDLDAACNVVDSKAELILAVHEALDDLAQESPRAAELVKRRYFAGMTQQEAADSLGISRATADRLWAYAKSALYCELTAE
jgi:RNA polymerase sigma factor (sigma-70 family)